MKSTLKNTAQWYEGRPLRERVMLLLCVLIILAFIVNLVVLTPLADQRRLAKREQVSLQADLAGLTAREDLILARSRQDPDRENLVRLKVLDEESKALQQQLEALIVNLVDPHDMPALLKELLTREKKLHLLSLENLPPQKLTLGASGDEASAAPVLFLHPLRLEFKGDYLTLLKYLRQLESLPKSLVLDEVDIETMKYPEARVRLQVYTLSLTEGWIGG